MDSLRNKLGPQTIFRRQTQVPTQFIKPSTEEKITKLEFGK